MILEIYIALAFTTPWFSGFEKTVSLNSPFFKSFPVQHTILTLVAKFVRAVDKHKWLYYTMFCQNFSVAVIKYRFLFQNNSECSPQTSDRA